MHFTWSEEVKWHTDCKSSTYVFFCLLLLLFFIWLHHFPPSFPLHCLLCSVLPPCGCPLVLQALAQAIKEAKEQHPDMSVTRVVVHKETELAEEDWLNSGNDKNSSLSSSLLLLLIFLYLMRKGLFSSAYGEAAKETSCHHTCCNSWKEKKGKEALDFGRSTRRTFWLENQCRFIIAVPQADYSPTPSPSLFPRAEGPVVTVFSLSNDLHHPTTIGLDWRERRRRGRRGA